MISPIPAIKEQDMGEGVGKEVNQMTPPTFKFLTEH